MGNQVLDKAGKPQLIPPMFEFYEVGPVRRLEAEVDTVTTSFKTFG